MSLWPELSGGQFRVHYVWAGTTRTRVLEAGSGPETLIFLHGAGGHLEAYQRNILSHAEHFRVFAIDMLGHGYTDKPDYDYELLDYVSHLREFCDAVGAWRVHLSGESLGGWVAGKFALAHPERTAKLLLNTAGGLTMDVKVMARLKELSLAAVREASFETVRKRLEWLMHDPKTVTDDLVETRLRIYRQLGFERAMEHIMCLQDPEPRSRNLFDDDQLRAIEAPTLVVWTSHDPTGAVEVGQRFAREIPDAQLVVMENCGHWPQFEDAPAFNRLSLEFLTN
ncbi:MAG TPA: alpha/beta hydrolase [Candidatus Acidoferrales bacterium]|nr:alpha/beta hydrolase [Candidatus Acidoferrales bacterium]